MQKKITPFLKWPGGKRWFTNHFADLLPNNYNRYIEPFLGGGSIFFHLKPKQAILGDINEELIITYKAIRDDWRTLVDILRLHHKNHNERYYYKIRSFEPHDPIERAARMIYLNRTCFNGIYRVNLQGVFNVPKGTKDNVLYDTDDFESVSLLLTNCQIRNEDFQTLINEAEENDFIFADPPYTVRHNNNGFIKYNETLFSWNDQIRLANSLGAARQRGVKIILTNANHQSVLDLYQERGFEYQTVSRYSSISATPKSRKQFNELIIHSNL